MVAASCSRVSKALGLVGEVADERQSFTMLARDKVQPLGHPMQQPVERFAKLSFRPLPSQHLVVTVS